MIYLICFLRSFSLYFSFALCVASVFFNVAFHKVFTELSSLCFLLLLSLSGLAALFQLNSFLKIPQIILFPIFTFLLVIIFTVFTAVSFHNVLTVAFILYSLEILACVFWTIGATIFLSLTSMSSDMAYLTALPILFICNYAITKIVTYTRLKHLLDKKFWSGVIHFSFLIIFLLNIIAVYTSDLSVAQNILFLFLILALLISYTILVFRVSAMLIAKNNNLSRTIHDNKKFNPRGLEDDVITVAEEQAAFDAYEELQYARETFYHSGVPGLNNFLHEFGVRAAKNEVRFQVHFTASFSSIFLLHRLSWVSIFKSIANLLDNSLQAFAGADAEIREINMLFTKEEDGYFHLLITDTGKPFETRVLNRLGDIGNSTRGSGLGFSSIFEMLRETNSAFVITEDPVTFPVTKRIEIIFFSGYRVEVQTYRARELRPADKDIIIIDLGRETYV